MRVLFLKRLTAFARIFKFFIPMTIWLSKKYLDSAYRAVLGLDEQSAYRTDELGRLAKLRQVINPPTEVYIVNIQVEGMRMIANLCQQYCGDIYYGLGFEKSELSLVEQFVGKGDVFFDVGANIGVYTLLASKLVGEEGNIHSFEPLDDVHELLRKNTGLNQCTNVALNLVAVGEKVGEETLYINTHNALSSLGRTNRGAFLKSQKVKITTLDAYAESAGISHVDFLKIDVEGFEGHVLRGAAGLLKSSPNLIVMSELAKKNFVPLGFSINETLNWMRTHGFEVWMVATHELKLYPTKANTADYPFQNFLFIQPSNPKYHLVEKYSAVL